MDREVGYREVGTAVWRKSSRSNNGEESNCVEVALTSSTALVRDSKNKASIVAVPGWKSFLGAVKRGDLGQV
ncbi:DUF397 domain-containing protein [Lentzea sp. NPDC006480]|uniref:DUF397 domain-containing protein n=1 Tax=Lentzea sp. NPDC006480 TaxID=3157176 RepID=UPI0033ADEB22